MFFGYHEKENLSRTDSCMHVQMDGQPDGQPKNTTPPLSKYAKECLEELSVQEVMQKVLEMALLDVKTSFIKWLL